MISILKSKEGVFGTHEKSQAEEGDDYQLLKTAKLLRYI